MKQKLEEYITQAQNNTIAFADLYAELKASPYGLRDGYISLLIACFLVQYKKTLIVSSHGSEQELSAELFEDIVKRPGDFCFTVAVWTKEEMAFVDALENTFQQKIDTSKLTRNRLKAVYDGMLSHYKSVSKFSRTTTRYVSDATQRYRQLMERSHTSYTHFFFEEAKDLTGNFEASIRSICDSKAELDGALNTLCQDLKRVLCSTFTLDFDLPLAGSLLGRYCCNEELAFIEKVHVNPLELLFEAEAALALSEKQVEYSGDTRSESSDDTTPDTEFVDDPIELMKKLKKKRGGA